MSIQTNSTSPNICIKRLRCGDNGYIDVFMQTNSISPNSCIKSLGGVGIKVILMCLCKQIVLVPTAVINTSEVWG